MSCFEMYAHVQQLIKILIYCMEGLQAGVTWAVTKCEYNLSAGQLGVTGVNDYVEQMFAGETHFKV